MNKKIVVLTLVGALMGPAAGLWASAGDATLSGPNGTASGQPAAKTSKKHHGHHHKKAAPAASSSSTGSTAPAAK